MPTKKTIKFYRKNVYGIEKMYVIDPDVQKALLAFNGHVTLTNNDKIGLEHLGFTFEEVLPPRKN